MKLLLDENLSRRLVPFLQHAYPGTSQVVLLGLESASDREVWQKAKDDGYVIVTRDADFQELSLVWGQPPKVVRLRTLNQTRAATLKVLLDNREWMAETILTHGLASVEIIHCGPSPRLGRADAVCLAAQRSFAGGL